MGVSGNISYLWHSMYLMERLILLLLALMLARIVFIVVRLSYLLAQRAGSTGTTISDRNKLVAELRHKAHSLRSIFSVAPYFGLLGTTLGILDQLSSGFIGSRSTVLMWVVLGVAVAFLSTAAGIVVAVPAVCVHNHLRMRLDLLEREWPSERLENSRFPLRPRLSISPFQLTAVPILALSIAAFMIFPSFFGPKGLHVHLMAIGALDTKVPSLEPIVIAVVYTKADIPIVYVNSKKTAWDELQTKLERELKARPPHSMVCIQADNDIWWQHLMYLIDVASQLHAEVVLLTAKPDASASNK
jgi:biopolymer transport protein ExbD